VSWVWGLFQGLGTWLVSRLLGKTPPASRTEVLAGQAATAETQLQTEKANDEAVQAAIDAADRVRGDQLRDPGALRAPNKYSRD
jgi:hypothetical protein